MKKSILKFLSATVLLACAAAPSFAGTIKAANFDLSYNDSFIPVSSVGNTVTFVSTFYFSTYGNGYAVLKDGFQAWAHPGQAFTGDVNVKTGLDYTLGNYQGTSSSYDGRVVTTIDVLANNCDTCSMYDAKLLAQGSAVASATTTAPGSGTATGAVDLTNTVGGTYDLLALYVINTYNLNPASGMLHLNSFSVTLDTVGPISSAVPELPPVAMLGLGLAALGLRARFGGRKTKAKATLAA
jgi:hypothetical protein